MWIGLGTVTPGCAYHDCHESKDRFVHLLTVLNLSLCHPSLPATIPPFGGYLPTTTARLFLVSYPDLTMPDHPTFLTLPADVRERIYLFTDLVRLCPISLGGDEGSRAASRKQRMEEWDNRFKFAYKNEFMERPKGVYCDYKLGKYLNKARPECSCPPLPLRLFSVCRAIHEEVTQILYSQNKFVIRLDAHCSDLRLNPKMVANMTSLSIRIRVQSYYPKHLRNRIRYYRHDRKQLAACRSAGSRIGIDPALSLEDDKDILNQWSRICQTLQTDLQPEMRLSLICDCADLETGEQVIQPMKAFPKISKCAIRLSQHPFQAPRQLAESMALMLTDRPPMKTFPFLDLPEELQSHVLCCTDLVSPYNIQYHPLPGSKEGFRPFEQIGPSCCLKCTDSLEACCCPLNSGAYPSEQCNCWSVPTALFLVSKHLTREAIIIFFSRNRFVIEERPRLSEGGSGMRRGLSLFRRLPALALESIRWIRFTFGGKKSLGLDEGELQLDGWKETAQFIEQNLTTSMLTIELDFKHGNQYLDMSEFIFELREETREELWIAYQNLAEVFILKDGLNDFFVHLYAPVQGSTQVDPQLRPERESVLEKRVMGEEYNAEARGKFTRRGINFTNVPHQGLYVPITN